MLRRDTLHVALDVAVTKTASYAPPAIDYSLDRFSELLITLNITAAERTTTQTYDFYLITGDGTSEWDLVHFPQIAVAGATKLTARVLGSLLPQTVTPAAPGVAAVAPAIINTRTSNAPKTLGAGLVAHGPWGNYLRYELVCAGTITTGITYTLQLEAAWSSRRAAGNAVASSGSTSFSYYVQLTTDPTRCGGGTSPNFTVPVVITNQTFLKTAANGGHVINTVTQVGGSAVLMPADLVFSSDTAGANKYPWEIESYDPVAGSLVAWVKLPSINNSTGVTFYMCYGAAGVTGQQNTGSFSPANAWDANYRGVWHIPSGAAPVFKDSSAPANDGTPTSIVAGTGKVGGCMATSGTPSRVQVAATAPVSAFPFTVEVWAKIASLPLAPTSFSCMVGISNSSTSEHYSLFWSRPDTSANVEVRVYGQSNDASVIRLGVKSIVPDTNWHHIVAIWVNSTSYSLYYDGVLQTFDNTYQIGGGNPSPAGLNSASFAQSAVGSTFSNQFSGALDEIRISNSVRGTTWILANYNAQNAPGTVGTPGFLVYGSEVATGATAIRSRQDD